VWRVVGCFASPSANGAVLRVCSQRMADERNWYRPRLVGRGGLGGAAVVVLFSGDSGSKCEAARGVATAPRAVLNAGAAFTARRAASSPAWVK
jgi:hypothetical protein